MKRSLLSLVLAGSVACGDAGLPPPMPAPGVSAASLTVTSRSFASNATIPVDASCDGGERSPQLTWSAPPDGTKSLAVVLDDPDAPGGTYTHWLVFDIPPDTSSLAEGVDLSTVPGARTGMNDAQNVRYGGPCPPRREIHRYVFHVYALDVLIEAPEGVTKAALYAKMNGHVVGMGFIVGLFSR